MSAVELNVLGGDVSCSRPLYGGQVHRKRLTCFDSKRRTVANKGSWSEAEMMFVMGKRLGSSDRVVRSKRKGKGRQRESSKVPRYRPSLGRKALEEL